MSDLDRSKLEHIKDAANGGYHARCPACAEGGHDASGDHLWVRPDGRFGCCVHPQDKEHRRRIWALAGGPVEPAWFRAPNAGAVCVMRSRQERNLREYDREVDALVTARESELAQTGKICLVNSDDRTAMNQEIFQFSKVRHDSSFGRQNLPSDYKGVMLERVWDGWDVISENLSKVGEEALRTTTGKILPSEVEPRSAKELENGVPDVPEHPITKKVSEGVKWPFLTSAGDLVIPFEAPARYRWWQGGQSSLVTRAELAARKENENSEY